MLILLLFMLYLIPIDANIKVTQFGAKEKIPHREMLSEVKTWINETINNQFTQNCQKPFEIQNENVKYLLQKVPCQRVGAKTR